MTDAEQDREVTRYHDEIDLRELFGVLWAGKWLICGITFVAAAISVLVALMLPNIYRAEALLAPNQNEGAGGLGALAAQYGGLASLAGIDLGATKADKTALGLEVLKSRKFVTDFVRRHDLLVPLVAAQGWDAVTGELEIDPQAYDVAGKKWVRKVGPPKKVIPSDQEAFEIFSNIFSVSQDKKSGFVTVAVEHYSPMVAKQWVDWLVEDINAEIMSQDVQEAEQAIEYLNKQIASTSLAELQNVFFNLIEEQTKTVMLAKVSREYLLKTLDPAVAPEKKDKPKRALIAVLGTMLGGFLGIVIVLVRSSLRKAEKL
jgi:uncharacterized protein involved in exopolysaccharide biosynthesis